MKSVNPHIPAQEHGVLRLFSVDMDTAAGRNLRDRLEQGGEVADCGAAVALGLDKVEAQWLALVPVTDLEGVGLESYLLEGYDVPQDQLKRSREELSAAGEYVLAVPSRAFAGTERSLAPEEGIEPLAQYETSRPPAAATPMSSTESVPGAARPSLSDVRGKGRELTPRGILIILLIVAAVLALAGFS